MNEIIDALVRQMTEVERRQSFSYVRPQDAATLILVDRSGAGPKVLVGRRHHGHRFMPGKYVFPGGQVDPLDRRMANAVHLDPHVEARLMRLMPRPSRLRARALALAAIRETFEETGFLLGMPKLAPPAAVDGAWAAFAQARVYPDLADIHFIARAITPPKAPRRFDTRFFTADASAIGHRVEGVVGPNAELVELLWIPIAETQRLDMAAVTRTVLKDLEHRVAAGMSRDLPVPFYRILHRRFTRVLL